MVGSGLGGAARGGPGIKLTHYRVSPGTVLSVFWMTTAARLCSTPIPPARLGTRPLRAVGVKPNILSYHTGAQRILVRPWARDTAIAHPAADPRGTDRPRSGPQRIASRDRLADAVRRDDGGSHGCPCARARRWVASRRQQHHGQPCAQCGSNFQRPLGALRVHLSPFVCEPWRRLPPQRDANSALRREKPFLANVHDPATGWPDLGPGGAAILRGGRQAQHLSYHAGAQRI